MTVRIVGLDHRPAQFKVEIYGELGAGKTYLAGTASQVPQMSPVLFGNVEGGELTIRNNDNMQQTERLESFAEVEELVQMFSKRSKEVAHYKTLVLDSLTAVRDILAEELLTKMNRKGAMGGTMLDRGEWGYINIAMKRLVRSLVNLPINVIVTALPRSYYPKSKEENPSAEAVEVTPDFSRKLHNSVAAMFDSLWYLYEDEGKRHLLTQPYPPFAAKTRGMEFSSAIGKDVLNPSFPALFSALTKTSKKK